METPESLAQLLNLGPHKSLQPPRFAKVLSTSGDYCTVALGDTTAQATRCCVCSTGDIVLLETLPSGALAAVGARGQSGGTGVQSISVGAVEGATLAVTGTATDPVLDLEVFQQGTDGIWTWRKYPDGTAECWGQTTWAISGWTAWGSLYYHNNIPQIAYPSGLFISGPIEIARASATGLDTMMYTRSGNTSATQTRAYGLLRPTTGSNTTGQLYIYSIGRWQA